MSTSAEMIGSRRLLPTCEGDSQVFASSTCSGDTSEESMSVHSKGDLVSFDHCNAGDTYSTDGSQMPATREVSPEPFWNSATPCTWLDDQIARSSQVHADTRAHLRESSRERPQLGGGYFTAQGGVSLDSLAQCQFSSTQQRWAPGPATTEGTELYALQGPLQPPPPPPPPAPKQTAQDYAESQPLYQVCTAPNAGHSNPAAALPSVQAYQSSSSAYQESWVPATMVVYIDQDRAQEIGMEAA